MNTNDSHDSSNFQDTTPFTDEVTQGAEDLHEVLEAAEVIADAILHNIVSWPVVTEYIRLRTLAQAKEQGLSAPFLAKVFGVEPRSIYNWRQDGKKSTKALLTAVRRTVCTTPIDALVYRFVEEHPGCSEEDLMDHLRHEHGIHSRETREAAILLAKKQGAIRKARGEDCYYLGKAGHSSTVVDDSDVSQRQQKAERTRSIGKDRIVVLRGFVGPKGYQYLYGHLDHDPANPTSRPQVAVLAKYEELTHLPRVKGGYGRLDLKRNYGMATTLEWGVAAEGQTAQELAESAVTTYLDSGPALIRPTRAGIASEAQRELLANDFEGVVTSYQALVAEAEALEEDEERREVVITLRAGATTLPDGRRALGDWQRVIQANLSKLLVVLLVVGLPVGLCGAPVPAAPASQARLVCPVEDNLHSDVEDNLTLPSDVEDNRC